MLSFLFLVLYLTWMANACPNNCSCSRKLSAIICVNGHRSSVPDNLPTDYKVLILRFNRITRITNQDLNVFKHYQLVDLRNNPINCTNLNLTSEVLTDCNAKTKAPSGPTTTDNKHHKQPTYTTGLLQTGPTTVYLTSSKRKSSKSKTFWIVFSVILIVVLLVVFILVARRKLHGRRVITITSIELDTLTGQSSDEEDEVLFEGTIKDKQL